MVEVESNGERFVVCGLSVVLDHDDDFVVLTAVDRLRHAEHRLPDDQTRR